jgi:uncharacterized protein
MTKGTIRVRGISKTTRDKIARSERKLAKQTKTKDTFQNFGLNIGIGTDNALSQSQYGFNPITRIRTLLEWIHRGSWIGGIAVDLVADDMTRAGIDINSTIDPKGIEKIKNDATARGTWNGLNETVKWGRLYGGAIGWYMIDGQDPSTPLRIESVRPGQFRGIFPLDRWQVEPQISSGQLVNEMGPNFGLPMFYRTISQPGLPNVNIHYTRCFRAIGIKLPFQQRIMEMMWGLSVLERINDRMIAFDSTTMGAAQLAYKLHYRIMKIKDLRNIIAAGGKAAVGLTSLVDMMRRYQSLEGLTLIDTEDEFEGNSSATSSVAGIAELLVQFGQQLSGALQIPLVRMFGQSPAGLSATGESDLRMYYDNVKQDQEKTMRVPVHTIYRLHGQNVGIPLGEDFGFEFRSLWQMSDQQQADVSGRDTESVLSARERGLISDQLALQELRQRGRTANRWTNITDEMINKAEEEPAPPPVLGGEMGGSAPISTKMAAIPKHKGDSAHNHKGNGVYPFADKASKEAAHYLEGPVTEEPCKRCSMYLPQDSSCSAVDGAVAPEGHCDYWEPNTDLPFWKDLPPLPPAVRLAIQFPEIDWDHAVSEIAVSAKAGGKTYIDYRMARILDEPGLVGLDPSKPLNLHEQIERWLMVVYGLTYPQAHRIATREERRWFFEMGYDWHAWSRYVTKFLAFIKADRAMRPPPPDPHVDEGIAERTEDMQRLPMREIAGLPIIIEFHKGERRGGRFPPIMADYGYIRRTSSAEGREEAMDCFVGPDETDHAWIIDQFRDDGEYDEAKVMFGFEHGGDAAACWDVCYKGAQLTRSAPAKASFDRLRSWISAGDVTQPFTEYRP